MNALRVPLEARIADGVIFPSSDAQLDAVSADQVLAESARRLLDVQVASLDAFDARIAASFGVGSTVLPVTIGLLNLLRADEGIPRTTTVILAIALAAYVSLIAGAGASFFTRNADFRPNIEDLRANTIGGYTGIELRRCVAEEYITAIEANRPRLKRKSIAALVVNCALYAEALLLSVAALVTLW
jgi:hypothetical protein